jgi:hypothetical protein
VEKRITQVIISNQILSEKQLRKGIEGYVSYYNNERRQLKTEKTPVEIREEYYRNQNVFKVV